MFGRSTPHLLAIFLGGTVGMSVGVTACGDEQRDSKKRVSNEGGWDQGIDETVRLDLGVLESGETDADGGESAPMKECEEEDKIPANAGLIGRVWAPNGEIPISGAVVYTTDKPPVEIPDRVYCTECVRLACDIHYTLSEADGSFELPAVAGQKYLVVQKGQFMRVSEIEVREEVTRVDSMLTTLPAEWNPEEGRFIPRMAIGLAHYDRLEDAMAKLGLGEIQMEALGERLVFGTESFDIWTNGHEEDDFPPFEDHGPFDQLLRDAKRMDDYHIIFVPCTVAYDPLWRDETVVENIRNWVAKGGKWYVTDWSNEYLFNPFDDYQRFFTNANQSADLKEPYDTEGKILDEGLLAWMEALSPELKDINPRNPEREIEHPTVSKLPYVDLRNNYTALEDVYIVEVEDEFGWPVNIGHKTWVEGPASEVEFIPEDRINPMTVSADYGCGKIFYSTYHTAENEIYFGLEPQELILMYLILEIGVCQEQVLPVPD